MRGMAENLRDPALPARPKRVTPTDPSSLESAHFALPSCHGYRPRGSTTWLAIYTVSGSGFFRSEAGTAAFAAPGDLFVYPAGIYQEYGTVPGSAWEFDWVHFAPRPAWAQWLSLPSVPDIPGVVRTKVGASSTRRRIAALFGDLHVDIRLGGPWRTELARNAIERILLLALGESRGGRGGPLDPRIQHTLETIASFPARRFTVDELARAVHLSPSRFSHLFREQTGATVIETVLRTKMTEAAKLLVLSSEPVATISADLGFGSPFYFSTQFRRHYGVSPRAFRRSVLSG
jgi:AraC family transcriptional regulator, arabinose operon regulatory protein